VLLVADKYPWIREELEAVKLTMDGALHSTSIDIRNEIKSIMHKESDLLRALFVILASRFGNYNSDNTIKVAAVIELIYLSSKLQVDGFTCYGEMYTSGQLLDRCFAGNYLLAESMKMMSENLKNEDVKAIMECYKELTVSEYNQLSQRFTLHNSKRTYIKHMEARSGSIFAMCFNVGAVQSNNNGATVRNLTKIGFHIGIARQLIDDLLDIDRDEEMMGKTIGHNIREGVYSLPIYYLSKKLPEETNRLLQKKPFKDKHLHRLIELMIQEGAIDKTRHLAQSYIKKVYAEINLLPQSEYTQVLFDTASSLLERRF